MGGRTDGCFPGTHFTLVLGRHDEGAAGIKNQHVLAERCRGVIGPRNDDKLVGCAAEPVGDAVFGCFVALHRVRGHLADEAETARLLPDGVGGCGGPDLLGNRSVNWRSTRRCVAVSARTPRSMASVILARQMVVAYNRVHVRTVNCRSSRIDFFGFFFWG